ncbi:hypothetical protein H5410_004208 [Solanum commersonii]|uniref:Uncharacterized protein n=1 Tax=Solanum commersonii TaxID=4109 RepID=A0A9J6B7B0_SOLCO|nr:hypothetical protein H5410_004208 [Solanum commersonii]
MISLFVDIWGNEAIYTEFSKWLTKYTMNKYCVSDFKFQTEEVSRNKKTNNSGVCIQGDADGTVDVELETTLEHPQHILEEVFDDEIMINVEEQMNEDGENDSFDDKEYNNENETTKEEEWENVIGGEGDRSREHLVVSQLNQTK